MQLFFCADLGTFCIFMEHIEGESLKALLQRGVLSGTALEAVLEEVGRAVARLHDGGLVHGDLTTSNILVRSAGM